MAVYSTSAAGGGTTGTPDRSATITSNPGDLCLVFCAVSGNTNNAPTCSDDNGGTYDLIDVGNYQNATPVDFRLSAFVRTALFVNVVSTTITVATGSNTSGEVVAVFVTGMSRLGLSAIRQIATQDARASGTTPAPAFSVAALTGNLTIGVVGNCSNPAALTTPTSWLEQQDVGQAAPTVGVEVVTRNSGFTGTTVTWNSTSASPYASIVLELDTSAAGGASFTLIATPGAYAITGTSTPLLLARRATATAGAYAIAGTPVALIRGRTLVAQAGSYTATGTAVALIRGRTFTAQAGSYTATGTAVMLRRGRTLGVTPGVYGIAGTPTTLLLGRRLAAVEGAYSISGTSATLTYTPAGAAFVLTAQPGAYALSGTLATLRAQRQIGATPGVYALTGTAATLTYTPAGVRLTALPGSYAITGTSAGLRVGLRLIPSAGAYSLAGTPVGLRRGRTVQVAAGAYALIGTVATLRRAARVVATAGVYTIVGTPATLATIPLGQDFDEVLWDNFAMRQPWSGALVMRQPASGQATMRQPRAGTLTMRQPSAGNVALLEED